MTENNKSIYKGITDDKGEIRFNVLDDKGYKISANKAGYKDGVEKMPPSPLTPLA